MKPKSTLPKFWWGRSAGVVLNQTLFYMRMADALLGAGVRPFEGFRKPVDMRKHYWYGSVFATSHHDLARVWACSTSHSECRIPPLSYAHSRPLRPRWFTITTCLSSFASRLSRPQILLNTVRTDDAWVLEAGSFIGNSATVWANTAKDLGMNAAVVCIDTWLGDQIMWVQKGNALGPPGADGQPRLYEQFMLNVAGKNASDRIVPVSGRPCLALQLISLLARDRGIFACLPRLTPMFVCHTAQVRMPAAQGFEYVHRQVRMGYIPPPSIIYIDTAHTYPEMVFELEAAWALLRPGGFLTGDDYTHYFPPVQQALNEWVQRQPPGSFVPPLNFALGWGSVQKMRFVRILTPGDEANASTPLAPFLLRLPGQWVLRKPHLHTMLHTTSSASASPPLSDAIAATLHSMPNVDELQLSASKQRSFANRLSHLPLSCCLNGWANPDPEPLCSVTDWTKTSKGKTGDPTGTPGIPKLDAPTVDQHQPRVKQRRSEVEKAAVAECLRAARQGGPYYTRCNPAALPLQQATCNLPAQRTKCVTNFRCRELGHALGASHGRGRGGRGRGGRGGRGGKGRGPQFAEV